MKDANCFTPISYKNPCMKYLLFLKYEVSIIFEMLKNKLIAKELEYCNIFDGAALLHRID